VLKPNSDDLALAEKRNGVKTPGRSDGEDIGVRGRDPIAGLGGSEEDGVSQRGRPRRPLVVRK
jgi:hypothetical protein